MYAFCRRARMARDPETKAWLQRSQADGGIRTLDPRFTRDVVPFLSARGNPRHYAAGWCAGKAQKPPGQPRIPDASMGDLR